MDWQLLGTPAGAHPDPSTLPEQGWLGATVPGTVAQIVPEADLESQDWWYRCALPPTEQASELVFEGLATICEVFLDGQRRLGTGNMFRRWTLALEPGARALALVFRSLDAELSARRPRPRWKTALVTEQKLRFVRTSLAGRIPGWTPPFPAIGPWRPVRLRARNQGCRVRVEGRSVRVQAPPGSLLRLGERTHELPGGEGSFELPQAWWPHTHGEPTLVDWALELEGRELDRGRIGARTLDWELGDRVSLRVNDQPVFCRGACWATSDALGVEAGAEELRGRLVRARDAGLNMIRVGGTGVYASPALLALCDELGVLVWQDLMFANMDYPLDDDGFRAEVEAEVIEQLRRLSRHPCVALICGGSEVEQQAAMMGMPEGQRAHAWFGQRLAELVAQHLPGVPCLPSTPWGGALPFSTRAGVTHYFGVGAYRRPLTDARLADVRFAAECLGFSNLPSQDEVEAMSGGATLPTHDPVWKAGVPRDRGTGWDFEDIRDHYLRDHFGVDPVALRSQDLPRYLELSRALTGELMLRVFAEWRRPASPCAGALVWLFQDLVAGAGCGLLDHRGQPKAALFALSRAWAPQAALLTDEGLNGVDVHVHNEGPEPLAATLELELLRGGRQRTGFASAEILLAPHESRTLEGEQLLGSFGDLSYAYRFGPPRHELVVSRLLVDGRLLHQDVLFPLGMALASHDAELSCEVRRLGDGCVELELSCERFLQALSFRVKGWRAEDEHLHLVPGRPRVLRFHPLEQRPFKVAISALNWERVHTVRA